MSYLYQCSCGYSLGVYVDVHSVRCKCGKQMKGTAKSRQEILQAMKPKRGRKK